jgi:hypothetical protein
MTNHAICEVWCIYYPCVFLDNPIYPIFCIYVSFLSVWPFFNRMLLLIVPSKVLFIQKFKEFQNSKVFWNIHSCLTLSKIQQLQTPARPRVCSAARQSRVGSYSNNLGRRSAFPIGKELLFWSKGIWENRSSDLTVWNVGTDFSGPKDTHFQVKKNITSFAAELAWIDGFLQGFCEVLIRCDQREICLCCEFLVVFLFNYSKFTRLFPSEMLMFGWCHS